MLEARVPRRRTLVLLHQQSIRASPFAPRAQETADNACLPSGRGRIKSDAGGRLEGTWGYGQRNEGAGTLTAEPR